MDSKSKGSFALICNILNFAAVAFCVYSFMTRGGSGNMNGAGTHAFVYFTVDSNILCAAASLLMIPYNLKMMRGDSCSSRYCSFAQKFKYASTVAVTLTFLVVACFLGLFFGDYFALFKGTNFHLHFSGPVLAVLSFCISENAVKMGRKDRLIPFIPVAVYGVVYFYQVVIRSVQDGGWVDFYHFNVNGKWYFTAVLILCVAYVISLAEYKWNQRKEKKNCK